MPSPFRFGEINLQTKSDLETFRAWNNQFTPWQHYALQTWTSYDPNYENNYYLGYEEHPAANTSVLKYIHDFTDISTDELREIALYTKCNFTGPAGVGNVIRWNVYYQIYYDDATFDYIIDSDFENVELEDGAEEFPEAWFNYTLPTGKTFDYLLLYVYISRISGVGGVGYLHYYLDTEIYRGFLPEIESTEYPDYAKSGETIYFAAQVNNTFNVDSQYLILQYYSTGNTKTVELEEDWTTDNYFYTNIIFNRTGFYLSEFRFYNVWSNYSSSTQITLVSDYPMVGYYDFYSSIDALGGLDHNLFITYFGDDEESSLIDFRNFYGSWTYFEQGSGSGNFSYGYERMILELNSSGYKSYFEDSQSYNVTDAVLAFEIKTSNENLTILMNPSAGIDRLYFLNIPTEYQGNWTRIEVPFYFFERYSSTDIMNEIGFFSLYVSEFEISKIKLCAYHYTTNYESEIEAQTNETILRTDLPALFYSDLNETDLLFNTTSYNYTSESTWLNVSQFQNGTFYFTTNASADCRDLHLNETGQLLGNQSFYDDTIGSEPQGWDVTETGACTVSVVETVGANRKVVEIHGESSDYANVVHEFDANQTSGIINYYFRQTDVSDYGYILVLQQGTAFIYMRVYAGNLQYNDGTIHTICSLSDNTWYNMSIEFNTTLSKWNITVNDTKYGEYNPFSGVSSVDQLKFQLIPPDSEELYFDSVDYNWTLDFYQNRYMECRNGTYTDNLTSGTLILNNLVVNSTNNSQSYTVQVRNSSGEWQAYTNNTLLIDGQWKVLLNTTNGTVTPMIHNVSFNVTETGQIYNQTTNFSIELDWLDKERFINASIQVRIRANATCNANISIFNFSSLVFQNFTQINASWGVANFSTLDDNFFNETHIFLFNITSNSTTAHQIEIDYINVSIYYYVTDRFVVCFNQSTDLSAQEEIGFWYNFTRSNALLQIIFHNATGEYALYNLTNQTDSYLFWANITGNDYDRLSLRFIAYNTSSDYNCTVEYLESYQLSTYRLQSDGNIQFDELTWDTETQTILVTDYLGNEILREIVEYTTYLRLEIPIVELILTNNLDETLYFEFEHRTYTKTYAVPAYTSYAIRIFTSDYWVTISSNYSVYTVRYVSVTNTSKRTISYGELTPVTPPEDLIDMFLEMIEYLLRMFLGNPLMIWLIAIGAIIIIVVWTYYRYKDAQSYERLTKIVEEKAESKPTRNKKKSGGRVYW